MCHLHIENELLMHSMKSVGKTMKNNIRVVDCFALFRAHQHHANISVFSPGHYGLALR